MRKIYSIIFVLVVLFVTFYVSSPRQEQHSFGQLFLPDFFREGRARILFVGDMMFDRYIRQVGYNKGEDFIFSCIGDFLKDSDLVVGNLEGSITDNPSISMGSEIDTPDNYVFTFPPSTAELLANNNIRIVNLGDNHIGNFGQEGIISTKKYLDEAGVGYFGGLNGEEAIYRVKIGGNNISFVSYNEFGGESSEKVAQKISEEKSRGQIVLVYAHWGDEYSPVPSRVKYAADLFAKSGADFIISSHPHIILPSEKIHSTRSGQVGDTIVYYSLGNFIFDQYWNKEVSTGLVLEINIKGSEISVIEHKVSLLSDGRTCLVTL